MDRLAFVRDICHLFPPAPSAWRSCAWNKGGMLQPQNFHEGFTDTVFSTRLFSWRRHYTKTGNPPPLSPSRSLITLDEWVPGMWPLVRAQAGWRRMGNTSHHGIFYLSPEREIIETWSNHAKRHLKTFLTSGCTVRHGDYSDLTGDMLASQVPRAISMALAKIIAYRKETHPETIEIFVAENAQGKRIACFAVAHDAPSKESMYLMGYFLPEAKKLQPMTGLVYTWLSRLQAQGFTAGNFGLMLGPHTHRWDPWWGLSNFKTHFGITRVHLPPSFWKIT